MIHIFYDFFLKVTRYRKSYWVVYKGPLGLDIGSAKWDPSWLHSSIILGPFIFFQPTQLSISHTLHKYRLCIMTIYQQRYWHSVPFDITEWLGPGRAFFIRAPGLGNIPSTKQPGINTPYIDDWSPYLSSKVFLENRPWNLGSIRPGAVGRVFRSPETLMENNYKHFVNLLAGLSWCVWANYSKLKNISICCNILTPCHHMPSTGSYRGRGIRASPTSGLFAVFPNTGASAEGDLRKTWAFWMYLLSLRTLNGRSSLNFTWKSQDLILQGVKNLLQGAKWHQFPLKLGVQYFVGGTRSCRYHSRNS